MGELSYILRIEVTRSSKGLHLSHRRYTLDLLDHMKMTDAKLVTTPKLTLLSESYSDLTEYRMFVGSLQNLAFTHPAITYAVNHLSQFIHTPTCDH